MKKLKKRYILGIAAALLGAIGVPYADEIVAIGDAAYTAAQGHSPK